MARRWLILWQAAAVIVTMICSAGTQVAHASTASTGSCLVRITRWVFQPNTVAPGAQTQLILTLRNCTEQRRQISVIWYGSGQNCPTIDPAPPTAVWLSPQGRKTKTWQFTAPPCGSSGGQENVTVRVTNHAGHQLATRTTKLTVT